MSSSNYYSEWLFVMEEQGLNKNKQIQGRLCGVVGKAATCCTRALSQISTIPPRIQFPTNSLEN